MKDSSTQFQYNRAKSRFDDAVTLLAAAPLGNMLLPSGLDLALIIVVVLVNLAVIFGVASLIATPWQEMLVLQKENGIPGSAMKVRLWGLAAIVVSFHAGFAGSAIETLIPGLGELANNAKVMAALAFAAATSQIIKKKLPQLEEGEGESTQ